MANSDFTVCGRYFPDMATEIEIQINDSGDGARYRETIRFTQRKEIKRGRWQEIKYSADGSPYIKKDGRRLYLRNFIRVYMNELQ